MISTVFQSEQSTFSNYFFLQCLSFILLFPNYLWCFFLYILLCNLSILLNIKEISTKIPIKKDVHRFILPVGPYCPQGTVSDIEVMCWLLYRASATVLFSFVIYS